MQGTPRVCTPPLPLLTDADVDTLDVDTSSKDVGCYQDPLFEALKLLISVDSLLLLNAGVNANAGKIAFYEEFVQFIGSSNRLHKDDDLVEFKRVKEVVQFTILGILL
jgi:hypothetical protein